MSYHLDPEEIAARRKLFAGCVSVRMPAPDKQADIKPDPKLKPQNERTRDNPAWQRAYYAKKKQIADRRRRGKELK